MLQAMHILIISGLSGSGKSIALNLLEDAAYYCVDNLPPQLLQPLVDQLGQQGCRKIAVAIDIRGGGGIETLPQQLDTLLRKSTTCSSSSRLETETLRKRAGNAPPAPAGERRAHAVRIDRRGTRSSRPRRRTRASHRHQRLEAQRAARVDTPVHHSERRSQEPQTLTLSFRSFGFKHGLPLDAELVFDVRCLPNPLRT